MRPHRLLVAGSILVMLGATTLGIPLGLDSPARADDAVKKSPAPVAPASPNQAARRAFEDMRFGLFLHWGVYSLLGKGEWVMERDTLPIREYEKIPARFNPTAFDADAWVRTAKSAGMKYITITAKHHDGFCMYDSQLTRYDVVDATPYGKDPLKALADACHAHGIVLFFYYSLLDWHHPDYVPLGRTGHHAGREESGEWAKYVAYYQGQVRELCSNYGKIGGIWFDGWWDRPDAAWDLEGTYRLIHELQPGALVGNNHHVAPKPGEDFQMFERDLPGENQAGFNQAGIQRNLPLETCETLNRSWGYNASDHAYKSATDVIRLLAASAGRGANLLLNVGPLPNGKLPPEAIDRLGIVGSWLETHGESIYGTSRGPIDPRPWGVSTSKHMPGGGPLNIYLHVFHPEGPLILPEAVLSLAARPLGGTRVLPMTRADGQAVLDLPDAVRDPADTVIVLDPKVLAPEPVLRKERR
ncbi:MAG: alpha-L-fucosidase [Isosphaeraceae bacterium]